MKIEINRYEKVSVSEMKVSEPYAKVGSTEGINKEVYVRVYNGETKKYHLLKYRSGWMNPDVMDIEDVDDKGGFMRIKRQMIITIELGSENK